ncbi:MAG: hypothetical protein HYV96_08720 [Opitutae bacterium]|nr:hypothetical protein [Opitutae bacterium]
MKNTILIALLAASLGMNVWFAFARSATAPAAAGDRARAQAAEVASAASRRAANSADQAATAARPFVWGAPSASNDDLRTLAANLRAAGFPPAVVAKIVGTMLRDRAYAKVAELPFWQLSSNNRDVRKMQMEAGRELLRLQEEILGASGSQLATLDPNTRRERYGDLSDDKVAALLKIDRDYQDMMSDLAPSGAIGAEEGRALGDQFRTLEKERLADIKAALGPEAYADYERQNSGAASMVMRGLRDLKVTEEEYNALFAAQKARDPNASTGFSIVDLDAPRSDSAQAFYEQVRAILGDERAHTYLKSADPGYGQVARFTEKYPSLAPAVTYQLYELNNESRTTMRALTQRADGQPVDGAKIQEAVARLNSRLEALVGPEIANAYRSQGLGAFLRTTVRSAPSTTGTPAPSGAVTPPKG